MARQPLDCTSFEVHLSLERYLVLQSCTQALHRNSRVFISNSGLRTLPFGPGRQSSHDVFGRRPEPSRAGDTLKSNDGLMIFEIDANGLCC